MERTKHLLIVLLALLSSYSFSQNNKSVYRAYASGAMHQWKHAMDSIETNKSKSNNEILDLINYQYGYIAWCIGAKNIKEAEIYLKKSENAIKLLEQKNYNLSALYAYKAALTGYKIGMSPYKAPLLGPKSIELAKKSVRLDSMNALGYMQLGNIAYYAPKLFGGSKTEAVKHYLKALSIMEKSKVYKLQNWNYLNLLSTLINAYMDLGEYQNAKKYCIKTLAVEPDFKWVKNNLYPTVLKKIKQ